MATQFAKFNWVIYGVKVVGLTHFMNPHEESFGRPPTFLVEVDPETYDEIVEEPIFLRKVTELLDSQEIFGTLDFQRDDFLSHCVKEVREDRRGVLIKTDMRFVLNCRDWEYRNLGSRLDVRERHAARLAKIREERPLVPRDFDSPKEDLIFWHD